MRGLCILFAAAALAGCATTVETKRILLTEALDNPDDRKSNFEATLRVLDEHPDYVDEMFEIALRHPKTLERFIAGTSRELKQEWLAALTAKHLVQNPESLEQILVRTQEAAKTGEAKRAISRAIEKRASLGTAAMASRPSAVRTLTVTMVDAVKNRPRARAMFLDAMREKRHEVARMLASDPEVLTAMVDALTEIAAEDPAVADLILQRTLIRMDDETLSEATAKAMAKNPPAALRIVGQTAELAADQSFFAVELERILRRLGGKRGVGGSGEPPPQPKK